MSDEYGILVFGLLEVTAFEFAKSCSYTKAIAVLQNRGTI